MTASASVSQTAKLRRIAIAFIVVFAALASSALHAHGVDEQDKAFIAGASGVHLIPYMYLGAKHMVTGYDHIAFLVGVVFFLRRLKDVLLYASLLAAGHSITLIGGVLLGTGANSHVIDAIIGLSVVYKGAENIGLLKKAGWTVDARLAVFVFGLFHGLGLATKVQDLGISPNGLLANLIAFNVGVELGQVIVLALVVSLLAAWRHRPSFTRYAWAANVLLIMVGLALTGYQVEGYLSS